MTWRVIFLLSTRKYNAAKYLHDYTGFQTMSALSRQWVACEKKNVTGKPESHGQVAATSCNLTGAVAGY